MKEIVFDKQPPEIEVHIVNAEPSWPWLLTVSFHFLPENKAKSLFSFQIISKSAMIEIITNLLMIFTNLLVNA